MRTCQICLYLILANYFSFAQSFYLKPILTSKINNYSSNYFFNNYKFTENQVHYEISTPNFKYYSNIYYGINIGIKGKFYFIETGLCTENANSEVNIKVNYINFYKDIKYENRVKVLRSMIVAGLFIGELVRIKTKNQLWFNFGFDFISKYEKSKNYINKDEFSLYNSDFIISNTYYFSVNKFFTMANIGLEYKLLNSDNKNLLSLKFNYIFRQGLSINGLQNTVTISQNSPNGQKSFFYPVVSSLNGFYITLSKDFVLENKRKLNKHIH